VVHSDRIHWSQNETDDRDRDGIDNKGRDKPNDQLETNRDKGIKVNGIDGAKLVSDP